MTSAAVAQWEKVRVVLRAEFGDAAFNSWLKPLSFVAVESNRVRLSAPSRFMRDWVRSHYGDRLRAVWENENPRVSIIDIDVCGRAHREEAVSDAVRTPAGAETKAANNSQDTTGKNATAKGPMAGSGFSVQSPNTAASRARIASGGALGSLLDPRYRFETFVVGRSNELAYAAARRVAEQTEVKFNPLFLHGGVGLGKTHLMHAIAWHVRESDPERRVMYLSAEKFMYQFIRALRERDAMSFKETLRAVDILMIDDVQFFSRKDSTQEEFFHTFNALMDQNKQIVISADCSPTDLEDVEERVRSRLGWGLVADIHQSDYELRLGILQTKLRDQASGTIDPKILEFLAHRITSNIRELEGALIRLTAYSNLVSRPVSLEMAQEVLQDLLRANDRRITIEDIQKKVASHYNIRIADMHSARRARNVARPRQVAMYLAKQLTSRSLPEIGRKFGGRDHTTVMHAVKRIEELRQTESSLDEDIDLLRRTLEA